MEQATFAELEHDSKKRRTRREVFLEKMDRLVPWERLEKRIEPFHPKPGRGRRPYPLGTMLRVHCVQLCYNLSDPGMEDLLYEVESVRRFAGLRLTGPLPDETTILKFRQLLEKHDLGEGLFAEINDHLASLGHSVRKGTIVDASIVDAPSSTRNRKRERDPEMHQTRKGRQWYFGMKAHIGVDAETGLAHSLETRPANAADVSTAHAVLHGGEGTVWGDAGYQGVGKRPENRDRGVGWETAMRSGKRRQLGLFADRASWSDFHANQLRLLLSGLAHTRIEGMRRMALGATELARATPQTIRTALLKVGAVALSNTRRVRLREAPLPDDEPLVRLLMSRSHPGQDLFRRVAAALAPQPP